MRLTRFALLALLPTLSCVPENDPFARAYVMEDLDDGIGGPMAVARPGDLILENDAIRIAILNERHSMAPGLYGGSIVDADLQRYDSRYTRGRGLDQFNEMFSTANMNIAFTADPDELEPAPGTPRAEWIQYASGVEILADGSDGGEAVIRAAGPAAPFLSMLGALWALTSAPDLYLTTDYVIEPGVPWLTIRSTASYSTPLEGPDLSINEPVGYHDENFPLLTWAVETGIVMGDFYLSGGDLDVFAPGIGFDEDGAVYRSMQEGGNTLNDPFEFPFLAGVGDDVSYGIAPVEGTGFVPLFTASQTAYVGGGRDGDGTDDRFPAGSNFTYERYFFIGYGDVGSLVDQYIEAREIPYGTVRGHVLEEVTGEAMTDTDVFVFEPGARYPWNHWRTDVHPNDDRLDGSFSGRLPVGSWEISVHQQGRPDPVRIPIEVTEGDEVDVRLEALRGSRLTFEIIDETGLRVPGKLTLYRLDGGVSRKPALGDSFIAGNPEAVFFAMYGTGEVELPAGTYQAVASRGIEYEIDISEPFRVDENTLAHTQLQVVRSVDTSGWISADLHVHAVPSHDSGVSLPDRVRTMVAEGVEFFSSTDHDYITDYAPVIEDLGLEYWVQSAVGNETTTVEIGHFLGFPLQQDFTGDVGGAFDWTGHNPREIFDELRDQSDAAGYEHSAVFVGHPRDGILGYFDQYGFSPWSGTPGNKGSPGQPTVRQPILSSTNPLLTQDKISWDFDGLELLNGKRFDILRIPTQAEADGFAAGDGSVDAYQWVSRTMEEQEGLESGVYKLAYGIDGQIDDWFSLLNLGFRFTALGNSDTHGTTTVESGCPRNFVMSSTDDPAFIDDEEIALAVKEHKVVASYGPFVRLWVDDAPIGSDVVPEDNTVTVEIDVQAPSWVTVDHVELYQNGTLIREWGVPQDGPVQWYEATEVEVTEDSWFAVIVTGDGDLRPVFTPVEIPYIDLQLIITEALGSVDAVSNFLSPALPVPREHPVHPFAITNPVWVDLDDDGFDAPGIPGWFKEPTEP